MFKLKHLGTSALCFAIGAGLVWLMTSITSNTAESEAVPQTVETVAPEQPVEPTATPSPDEYPGKTIDQFFGVIKDYDFQDPELKTKPFKVSASGFDVVISRNAPVAIKRGNKTLLRFHANSRGQYWSGLVGTSHLLGPNSTQIYIVATGPGAVCCTNYWIADVTNGHPREIFRSELHGDFRDAMEIFDADGDGVYELVQFDSCFRYFRDDCGSCSPEPRVYFKYDRVRKQYLPAAGVQEDFSQVAIAKTLQSIKQRYADSSPEDPIRNEWEMRSDVLEYVADLFHLGRTAEAWHAFNKYDGDKQDREEIIQRLKSCKFNNELRRSRKK